jgi:hypothetical protein
MSEPSRFESFSLMWPLLRAQSLNVVVSAVRKPSSWVPPSAVLMVLAKVKTDSEYESFHCIATSTDMRMPDVVSSEKPMTVGCTGDFVWLRWRT